MKAIHEILELTPNEHEMEIFNAYWKWCEKLSASILDTQKILANSPMSRFYNTELLKCEAEFLLQVKDYKDNPSVTAEHKKRIYEQCIEVIYKNCRPVPLIEQAIKNQRSDLSLKTRILNIAVMGIKIDKLTLRLN